MEQLVNGRVDERSNRGRITHVDGPGIDLRTRSTKRRSRRVEQIRIDVGQHEIAAARCHLFCESPSETSCATGDDRNFS